MAQVWEATDETLARKVAVKLLHPHLAADESFVERFRREAVAAARLSHPSIVSIYDTCSDGDVEAIVMELVHGSTLRDYLNEHGPLEPGQAVAIVAEVADALDTAHRSGVVHRDIKPANILLSTDGRVLVADFGIAKAGERPHRDEHDARHREVPRSRAGRGRSGRRPHRRVRARRRALRGAVRPCRRSSRTPKPPPRSPASTRTPMRPRNVRAGIPKPLEDVTHARARPRSGPTVPVRRRVPRRAARPPDETRPLAPVMPADTSGADATAAVFPTVPRSETPRPPARRRRRSCAPSAGGSCRPSSSSSSRRR